MSRLIIFGLSFLEAIAINYIFGAISQYKILKKSKILLFALLLAIVATVTDYFSVPYHLIVSIAAILILFHIISGYKFISSSIDIFFSFCIFVLIQSIITAVAIAIYKDVLKNSLLLLVMLIVIVVSSVLLYKTLAVNRFARRYYEPYKNIIIVVVINIFFLITIVSKMFYYSDEELRSASMDIILIFVGYVVANIVTLIICFVYLSEKQRSRMVFDYGKSLERTINELKSMSHEHNSNLQLLSSMLGNVTLSIEERNEVAMDYLNSLTAKNKSTKTSSYVKDNTLISAVLHNSSIYAEQLEIIFTTSIESLLSQYGIADNDMADILLGLINNAFEEVCTLPKEKRIVKIIFREKSIEMINLISKKTAQIDINYFENQGFSTKGFNRGYGLGKIITIMNKYDAKFVNELDGEYYIVKLIFN